VPRDFVGALSDGADGVAALDFAREGIRAKKAWFFTGEEIVCLGADLHGASPAGLATTLNQTRARGAVHLRAAGTEERFTTGQRSLSGTATVQHDGWVYTLIEPGALHVAAERVTGHWSRVYTNPTTPPDEVRGEVFSLWLDHGTTANGASYAYAIHLDGAPRHAKLLANTASCQAVALAGGKVAVVFWAAGEFRLPDGRIVATDTPCLLLADAQTVRVAEPTQRMTRLQLSLNGVARAVTLPGGGFAGTPVTLTW
jgi:chondroitin AC lyase